MMYISLMVFILSIMIVHFLTLLYMVKLLHLDKSLIPLQTIVAIKVSLFMVTKQESVKKQEFGVELRQFAFMVRKMKLN